MIEFDGDIAIVTGGATGIGAAIVRQLVDLGCQVVVCDMDQETASEQTERMNERVAGSCIAHICDVTDQHAADSTLERCLEAFGPPTLLVNNAGITGLEPISRLDRSAWDKTFQVNTRAPFEFVQSFASMAIATGLRGNVVNISSLNYVATTEGIAHYGAAKAALSHFTKSAALEFGPSGIRVNAIAPGFTRTEGMERRGRLRGQMGEQFLERIPMGRFGETSDIAAATAFLLSSAADFITGITLIVDGGNHIRGIPNYLEVMK